MRKDLSKLFRWNTKVELKDNNGSIIETVYVRLVGDVDYNQAQQYALVSSRRMRKNLRKETTLEHDSLFFDLDEKDEDELIFNILMSEMSNFRDLAVEELGDDILRIPEISDNPSLEEREEQQEAEEDSQEEKIKKLRTKMDEKSSERREELKVKAKEEGGIEELRKIFVTSTVNVKCLEEFGKVFREYCVFKGTFSDEALKYKAFDDFEEFRNASPILKRQLTDAYIGLEISGEQLKN